MQYYLHRNEQQIGPYDEPQIRGMVASGAISRSDLCWREGLADWQPLEAVFQFALPPPITIPAPISPPPLPSAKPDAQFAHPAAKKKKIGLGTKVVIGLVLLVGLWAVFKPASSPPAVSPAHPEVAVSQPPQPSPVLKQKHPSTGVAGSQAPLSSSTKSIPPTSPAPSTPPPIDISTVTASEAPKKVALKSGEAFSVANGTGQITAPAGSVVDVVARSGDTLRLSFLGGSKDIHYSKTSFAAEVQAARERAAQIARAAKERAEEARKVQEDAERAKEIVQKVKTKLEAGEKPMQSSFDESVNEVKRYLSANLKDPKSTEYIAWSPVTLVDVKGIYGWEVTVKYRSKNSFGGYVIEQKTAIIQHGKVVAFQ